ncbi:7TM diverse intracellular signaling domain-containing protein [Azotobacter sp. CWF10]
MKTRLLLALFLLLASLQDIPAFAGDPPLPADVFQSGPIGLHTSYLMETGGRLSLEQAVAALAQGAFRAVGSPVPNFGIGSAPVWLHLVVNNPTTQRLERQLHIKTPWLDRVEVHFRHTGTHQASHLVADRQAFGQHPGDNRFLVLEHAFEPGPNELFIRVEKPDPMVVPLYLLTKDEARARERLQDYSYGFFYGFLFALLAYNFMLYAGLRDATYLLYSLYLGAFLLMNGAYTGHGFQWLWPDSRVWAQWSNPLLVLLYGSSGLIFALRFLDIRRHFPRLHQVVLGYLGIVGLMMLLAILAGSRKYALMLAFVFVLLFSLIMLALGTISMRSGQKPAKYFLLAAIAAMLGAAISTLAVWGRIPTNEWTYRAADIGMMLDATLLALALTYRFRVTQAEKVRAEQLATLDPLTGIANRRAFYDRALPLWNRAQQEGLELSLILLDIDHFKSINDTHGHACGDTVLVATARILEVAIRQQDVLARWGGEEFILLLPETSLGEAARLAERLRCALKVSVCSMTARTSPSPQASASPSGKPASPIWTALSPRRTIFSTARRKWAGTGSASPEAPQLEISRR